MKTKIKKGDTVKVISGKEKGKKGEVLQVFPKENKIVVREINIIHKAYRPTQQDQQGGIREQEGPFAISNVMLVCPVCGLPTRVEMKVTDGKKVRICKKCSAPID